MGHDSEAQTPRVNSESRLQVTVESHKADSERLGAQRATFNEKNSARFYYRLGTGAYTKADSSRILAFKLSELAGRPGQGTEYREKNSFEQIII